MLGHFNNEAQRVADKVDISDHSVVTPDGAALLARWYRQQSIAASITMIDTLPLLLEVDSSLCTVC
jgi:hypothetical protein